MNSERKAHCNKRLYNTLLAAQIGLKRLVSRQNRKGDPIITGLSAYKCPYCAGWHVGRSMMKGIDWALVARHDANLKRLPSPVSAPQPKEK